MILFLLATAATLFISFVLFRQAAGTLSLGKINLISYVYYLSMLQVVIGAILASLGYDGHYTLNHLQDKEGSVALAAYAAFFMMITLPFVMVVFDKCFRFSPKEAYQHFLDREMESPDGQPQFVLILLLTIIEAAFALKILKDIGYIPIVRLFFHGSDFDFGLERIRIDSLPSVNSRISSLLLLTVTPITAYISFAYAITNRKLRWVLLALFTFGMSTVVITYNFAKSPLVFHLFVYVLIVIYHHKGLRNRTIAILIALFAGLLMVYYRIEGYSGAFADIYNGILGRTLFTQFGTLCYHLELFPNVYPYLDGRSLSPTVLKLLGRDPSTHLRSAKLVMDYYGHTHVYEGTAGVMNTNFIGEAYANWGWTGMLLGIIWVGVVIALLFMVILKIKKSPATLAFMAVVTKTIGAMSQGGFTDFVYSASLIMMIAGFIIFIYFDNILGFLFRPFRKDRQKTDSAA